MSVARIRELLRESASDDVITLEEVTRIIAAVREDQAFTPGERLWLEAALEAHAQRFTPEGLLALKDFLAGLRR